MPKDALPRKKHDTSKKSYQLFNKRKTAQIEVLLRGRAFNVVKKDGERVRQTTLKAGCPLAQE
jgi:hypothetical protein